MEKVDLVFPALAGIELLWPICSCPETQFSPHLRGLNTAVLLISMPVGFPRTCGD